MSEICIFKFRLQHVQVLFVSPNERLIRII